MSAVTSIEWTSRTWNPTRGCSRVSAGCDHCYAMRMGHRFNFKGGAYEGLTRIGKRGVDWSGRVRFVHDALDAPLRWRKPQRVFVDSMSDLFHESLDYNDIAAVYGVMAAAPQHTFQILTKRPERRLEFHGRLGKNPTFTITSALSRQKVNFPRALQVARDWPLSNVWEGVSVEAQATADERIPLLLQTPAAVRFVSYEPALGPVDFGAYLKGGAAPAHAEAVYGILTTGGQWIDWIIVGGESGPGARPFDVVWPRSTVRQCRAVGVPVFYKQAGANVLDGDIGHVAPGLPWPFGTRFVSSSATGKRIGVKLRDRKGGDPSEWPADLRVREFPA